MTSPSPSPSLLPGSSKQAFVLRDQDLPLADQIQRTRGELYEQLTTNNTRSARLDLILELLQEYGPRLTNLEASVQTQHEQQEALISMSERIIQYLETEPVCTLRTIDAHNYTNAKY